MLIYIFLLLSIIIIFLQFVWHNMPYQWKVLSFGLATAPRVFIALTKPILFFCHHKGFHIVICLDDILVLVCSKWAGKKPHSFSVPYWFALDYILIFPSLTFTSLRLFVSGLCWDIVHMTVSLPPDKYADIQRLALSLLQTQPVTVCWVMSFLGRANFCANGDSQLWTMCHSIQSDI